jgi:hypothetical protein
MQLVCRYGASAPYVLRVTDASGDGMCCGNGGAGLHKSNAVV